jgi:hypothetical protein
MTLDQRWTRADLVVHADVVSAESAAYGQRAELSVIELLKSESNIVRKHIRVFTTVGGCPYPFNFRKGQRIIAFLAFDPRRDMYTPVGAFVGCISVNDQSYRRYSALLKKLPVILDNANSELRQRLLLDWYVDCAVQSDSRIDGARGISRIQRDAKCLMTSAQQKRLADALVSEKPLGKGSGAIVSLLDSYTSSTLDQHLLESLRRSHELGWKDLTRPAVERLPKRLGIEFDQETQLRHDEWGDLLMLVHYRIDRFAEPERYDREKERLAILWGSLTYAIYEQCRTAMDSQK